VADEKTRARGAPERFDLGASYDEVGPELGHLYDAWQVDTGQAALEFHPSDRVQWAPSGDYELRVTCRRSHTTIRLWVDASPTPLPVQELATIFMWMGTSLQRVEYNSRVSTHLAPTPMRPLPTVSRRPCAPGVLALMAGVAWLHLTREPGHPSTGPVGEMSEVHDLLDAPSLTDTEGPDPMAVAYPLPTKPFRNQAASPCRPDLDEKEINGGCWVELSRTPPCVKVQAEYQGKCYLPVSKDRGRLPTTVEP